MSGASELSAVKLALAAQAARAARQPTGEAGLLASEPIAIIGMGCRFPGGANDPEQLWTLLENGVDAVTRVPATRWDPALEDADLTAPGKHASPWAGMLDDIVGFDAEFFGIAPREAKRMDPQQRVLLEVTWDALRDAGCRAEALRGSPTGVFVAVYSDDYARNLYNDWDHIDAHTASGNAHGVTAGRISYLLDLRGPALAIDTACSSSLVALHAACTSLRTGETSLAIVGATNLLISPDQTVSLSKWGMMAPDGRCKTFDASADGWVRGEGAGTLVLKRLADALGDGDRVHAVIRGTAVNQDGHSAVLTAPNGLAQRAVVRAALANAQVPASRLTYMEAHGTGTVVGDPIELEALIDEIGHSAGAPCHIGTIKVNIGHLEAAAGMAGVIKVVQSMKHERIPPHLHFRSLNPLVSLDGTRLRISRDGVAWPAQGDLRMAGVSSFGLGGTNGHVILEEAPRLPAAEAPADGPWLATVSAYDAVALAEAVDDACGALAHAPARDVAWTLDTFDAMRHRVAAVGDSAESLASALREAKAAGVRPVDGPRRVAMVFSGHGSQWAGMARESLALGGVFATSLRESDAIVQSLAGWSLLDVLQDDAQAARLDDTSVFQPVLVAMQLAMAAQWHEAGVQPSAVLGHSVGELAAACVAGAITRDEALRIAVERGRLMQSMAGDGAMLAVRCDADAIRRVAAETPGVVIAGENGPGMLTLSGAVDAITACETRLTGVGADCRRVHVSRAFHSPAMHPAAAALAERLATLAPRPTLVPFHSSVTGVRMDGRQLDAQYWARNALDVVRFGAAAEALVATGIGALVEVSPHPILLTALHATFEQHAPAITLAPTWRRGRGERATWLGAVGTLWSAGVTLDPASTFSEPGMRVTLPGYRWQRRLMWSGSPLPLGRPVLETVETGTLPGRMTEVPALDAVVFEGTVRGDDPVLRTHRVCGRVVVPGTLLLLAPLDAARRAAPALRSALNPAALELRDVMLDRALTLNDDGARTVQLTLRADTSGVIAFTIASRAADAASGAEWDRHASGAIAAASGATPSSTVTAARSGCTVHGEAPPLYEALALRGVSLGAPFRLVRELCTGAAEAFVTLAPDAVESDGAPVIARHAARLDATLHGLGTLLLDAADTDGTWLPVSVDAVSVPAPAAVVSSHVVLHAADGAPGQRVADVFLLDAEGAACGMLRGLRLQRTERTTLARLVGAVTESPVLQLAWESVAAGDATPRLAGTWLVLEDATDARTPLADAIDAAGGQAVRFSRVGAVDDATGWAAELQAVVAAQHGAFAGVVFAWGLGAAENDDVLQPVIAGAVTLLQTLASASAAPERGVLFVTRGAAVVDGDIESASLVGGALGGLRHSAALEHPELTLRVLDLSPIELGDDATRVVAELGEVDGAPRVARRRDERLVAHLRPAPLDALPGPMALLPPARHSLDALALSPLVRTRPAPGAVEIAVIAAGLNFRDVLGALGMVALPTHAHGGECAGVISAVGDGVTGLAVGDRVLAFANGALRTHVQVAADLVAPMPDWMSAAHGGALPIAYLTAYHALVNVARLQRGERVLIHAAAGGVGLAAVHIARWIGAEVVGTAGSADKRRYLESLGVVHVFDSRTATFGASLTDASGRGTVDVVLNALSDAFIPMSIDVLAPQGRFVEIGKRGIWSAEAVYARRADVGYTVFDMTDLAEHTPAVVGQMLRTIVDLVSAGALPVLPTTTFPVQRSADAFRFMAQARQIGKIAIMFPEGPPPVRAGGTYLVTGAFGALGRAVVDRLVRDGARHLVLFGRRTPDGETARWIATLAARGIEAQVASADVGDATAVAAILQRARSAMPPLRGVVHCAGITDDGTLLSQTPARIDAVFRGKVRGAALLDRLTRDDPVEFFVLFSSASAVVGWSGQTTYASANAALDQVARRRRASGRPAQSLQWGQWAGGGMADRVVDMRRFTEAGMQAMTPGDALDLLTSHRATATPALLVIQADWQRFAATRPADAALYARLRRAGATGHAAGTPAAPEPASLLDQVRAVAASRRHDVLRDGVTHLAAAALGVPAGGRMDAARPLRDLGMDSLMAVELRNVLARSLGVRLPATLLFDYPSIDEICGFLLEHFVAAPALPADVAVDAAADQAPHAASADLAALSDDDAEALLLAELDSLSSEGHP